MSYVEDESIEKYNISKFVWVRKKDEERPKGYKASDVKTKKVTILEMINNVFTVPLMYVHMSYKWQYVWHDMHDFVMHIVIMFNHDM